MGGAALASDVWLETGTLTGARPVHVTPRVHADLGTGLGIDPADVAAALAANPGTRLVSVVSPSYTGVCSDTAVICATARAAGAVAYVDQAWGPHLDPLKLPADVTGLGLTGHHAEALLRSSCGIAPEGADLTSVHLVVGIATTRRRSRR